MAPRSTPKTDVAAPAKRRTAAAHPRRSSSETAVQTSGYAVAYELETLVPESARGASPVEAALQRLADQIDRASTVLNRFTDMLTMVVSPNDDKIGTVTPEREPCSPLVYRLDTTTDALCRILDGFDSLAVNVEL